MTHATFLGHMWSYSLQSKTGNVSQTLMKAALKAIANNDVRTAFGLNEKDKVKASRVIRDTIEAKLIKPVDPETAPRYMKYVPFWA